MSSGTNASCLTIGSHRIAPGQPPFIIAEAGVHHYGSVDTAKAYVDAAAAAGAQAIKFQTYTADKLTTGWAELYWKDDRYKTQYQVFAEKRPLSAADYAALFAYAAAKGVEFLSTPFDVESADMLNGLGMVAFKIASADITNLPLLRHIAKFCKPVLLSTGASNFDEVERAACAIREVHSQIALLHCSLAYPTPLNYANLKRIDALAARFPECIIGYSDHTRPCDSELVCPLAASRGACIIEKHFTLDRSLPGDDHYHAVDPDGLTRLVKGCSEAVVLNGNGREMTEVEQAARRGARRSIVAGRDLKKGTVLAVTDLDFKRPGLGLPPSEVGTVVGRRLACDVLYDRLIMPDMLE